MHAAVNRDLIRAITVDQAQVGAVHDGVRVRTWTGLEQLEDRIFVSDRSVQIERLRDPRRLIVDAAMSRGSDACSSASIS